VSASSFARNSVNPLPKPLKCFLSHLESILSADGIAVYVPNETILKDVVAEIE
jgi:hypothetical protein